MNSSTRPTSMQRRVSFSDEGEDDDEGVSFVGREESGARSEMPPRGILKKSSSSSPYSDCNEVVYRNLTTKMGLLKCDHAYRVAVPLHDGGGPLSGTEARVVEESPDGDLRGEIRTADGSCNLCITISTRRRGRYHGRIVIEVIRTRPSLAEEPTSNAQPAKCEKCLLTLQVDATIMNPNMGNPRLRGGIVCLGKIGVSDDTEENRGPSSCGISEATPSTIVEEASAAVRAKTPMSMRSYIRL